MSLKQQVPAWAREAVAQGWVYCGNTKHPRVGRFVSNGIALEIYRDGSSGNGNGEFEPQFYHSKSVSETLELSNEYAAANGGWA